MADKSAAIDEQQSSPGKAAGLSGEQQLELERAKLQQEREFKKREFELKEKELDLQRQQSGWARWSSPVVVAILAGLIGYGGTVVSNFLSRQNELDKQGVELRLAREKQEATLILEVIKTTGSAEEREKQTAANLVFFADAGLITSIKKAELEKLRGKAQGAGPALPTAQGVEFKRSSSLTVELQAKLHSALADYQAWLVQIGFDTTFTKDRIFVRIDDEEDLQNAYYDDENKSVVLGVDLARDPEYALSEYTWHILKQANPRAYESLGRSTSVHSHGFLQSLKFYFTCSSLNDPRVGKSYYSLTKHRAGEKGYLFNLDELKAFEKDSGPDAREEHKLGEVWGGALWDIRKALGREKTDRLVLAAWKRFQPVEGKLDKPLFYIETIIAASKVAGNEKDSGIIHQAFVRRKLS